MSSVRRTASAVLIVEDDPGVARVIGRIVPDELTPVVVHSVAEARGVLATPVKLSGAVVDIGLPDGSGLDVLHLLRTDDGPRVPVLVLTALLNPQLVNEVTSLGAQYVCKPDFSRNLLTFFDTLVQGGAREDAVQAAVTLAERELCLTKRERDILGHAMNGVPRGHLAEVLGISENTLKKYVRSLLEKTSQSSLSEVVWKVRTMAGVNDGTESGAAG